MEYEVIIVGGSYAGLAAALQLARARRKVLIIDAGLRRNRFAEASHGFLGSDGAKASEIAFWGRQQVLAYPTVKLIEDTAVSAERFTNVFRVQTGTGVHEAKRLILASGVTDHLPTIPGLQERWGKTVFHCPYCHGYELNQGPIGVLATSPGSMHFALMLPDWGPTTFFLNGAFDPDAEQRAKLAARGVALDDRPVVRIEGKADVIMADGGRASVDGLFTTTRIEVTGGLAAQLGCEIDDTPMGQTIRTDMTKATTVPGVYACGDAARPGGSLPLAVGDGTMAGAVAHQSLIFAAI